MSGTPTTEKLNNIKQDSYDFDKLAHRVTSVTEFGDIGAQNPIYTDGDSIYQEDIDVANSDNSNFVAVNELPRTASVIDYFNSLTTVNENTTSDNPKKITIRFKRTIQTAAIGFGCNDPAKGFGSNITVKVIGSADQVRSIASNVPVTNPNSFVVNFEPESANGIIIEFNDASPIALSNLIIYKSNNVNARIQAIQPNGNLVDASASNQGNINVNINEYGDTPAIDPFGNLRISQQFTIFDSKQLQDKQPLFWDEVTNGSATSVHSSVNARTRMTVTANATDYAVRQTKQRFNYQPGKGQKIFFTFQTPQTTGLTKRIGYYSVDPAAPNQPENGIFFECDGDLSWNIVKDGVITETVTQANWNVDTLDGSGVSGITYDTDGAQIGIIDFEWLGVGRVRVGFVIGGLIYYTHYFNHANLSAFDSVYMSTPNLPITYTILTDGTDGGYLDHICSTVISEGGQEKTGVLRVADTGSTHVDASSANTTYAIVGIRLKDAYKDISIIPEGLSMVNENNDDFRWSLHLNPTINGTFTFSDLNNSSVQTATGVQANTVSDEGIVISSGYASIDTQQASVALNTALRIGSTITGVQDELVLCATPLSNGADIQASLNFRELL